VYAQTTPFTTRAYARGASGKRTCRGTALPLLFITLSAAGRWRTSSAAAARAAEGEKGWAAGAFAVVAGGTADVCGSVSSRSIVLADRLV